MTEELEVRRRAVTAILRGVAQKTSVIASVAAVAALAFSLVQSDRSWWVLPVSILFGGGLGLLNFRWLASAVQRIYLRQGATPGMSNLAAAIINVIKLSIIFIILFVVIKWQLLHVFGLVAGLSCCFLAIIWQGAVAVKDNSKNAAK